MKEAGLFRILQPQMYGGYEYDFDVMVPVVSAVAAGCGSAGVTGPQRVVRFEC
jgi:alkylation response protein AidB-like acyl-CoA dehydrogenase